MSERSDKDTHGRPCYLHLSPYKLTELVKSKKPLNAEEMEALDEAWFHTFGVFLKLAERGATEPTEPDNTVLGVAQVLRMTGLSLTSLKRRVLYGDFPKPHRVSAGLMGWSTTDVATWLDAYERAKQRP